MDVLKEVHMIHFLMQHELWTAVVVYWIFSAAVSGLPVPAANDQAWYVWLYSFCHTIAGNISNVVGNKIPGLKIPPFAVLTPLVLAVTACTAHYTVHPGALNKPDGCPQTQKKVWTSSSGSSTRRAQAGLRIATRPNRTCPPIAI
jgi:hypothetical protein